MAQVQLDLQEANGHLPQICMRCGKEASVTKTRDMSWCPPWVAVLILAGLLPYAIVAMILTKRARVQVPLCEDHKWHWINRNLIIWGGLLVAGALVVAIAVLVSVLPREHQDMFGAGLCIAGGGLFFVWVIGVVIAQSTAIRPKEINDHSITIEGVAAEFVEAIEERERKRRAKLRRRDDDWDEEDDNWEDDRPLKKRSKSDAIEEDRPRKKRRRDDDDDLIEERR
jgi:hypothetical protein